MTDEEKLLEITEVLKKHNKPLSKMSDTAAIELIRQIVNEDKELVTAHWIPNGKHYTYVCSNCKCEFLSKFDRCPYCFAFMREDDRQ